jgi:putative peptide zinc metalloprotease protein
VLPALGGLPLLLGDPPAPVVGPGVAPAFGVHPPSGYPPLAGPPGEPPSTVDDDRDRKFERKLWWLLILLLLFALFLTGTNFLPGPAWGEMPQDRALLQVGAGTVRATVDGTVAVLHKGDEVYVSRSDRVVVADRSLGRLTFRGGGYTIVCADTDLTMGSMSSTGYRPAKPSGGFDLISGRVLADTTGTSRTFTPLDLTVGSGGAQAVNSGVARFAIAGRDVTVAAGSVAYDGAAVPVVGGELRCGDSGPGNIPVPPAPSDSPFPTDTPSPSDSPSPSPSPSPSASAGTTPTPTPSRSPGRSATPTPTPTPTKTPTPTPTPTPTTQPPPKDTTRPTIVNPHLLETLIAQAPPAGASCGGQQQQFEQIAEGVYANDFTDPDDPTSRLTFFFTWTLNTDGTSGKGVFRLGDGIWAGGFSVPYAARHSRGGVVTVDIVAIDPAGNRTDAILRTQLDVCIIGSQQPG